MPAPTPTDTAVLTDTDTMARGPLMPRLPLRPTLMLTMDTTAMPAPTPMDMAVLTDTDTPTDTTERGLLRPSPRPTLRPMPLFSMELTDTPMVSVPTAMALSAMPATPMA